MEAENDLQSSILDPRFSILDLAAPADRPAEHSRDVVNRRTVAVHVKHGRQGSQQSLVPAGLLSRGAKLSRQIARAYSLVAPRASERAHDNRRQHQQQRPDLLRSSPLA